MLLRPDAGQARVFGHDIVDDARRGALASEPDRRLRLTVRAVPLPDAVPPELPALHPLAAGRRYLPLTLAPLVIAPLAGALIGRAPARVLIAIGLGMPGVGMIWMSGISATDHWSGLLGGFPPRRRRSRAADPVIADVALKVVPREQSGMAAGINDTFRQVAWPSASRSGERFSSPEEPQRSPHLPPAPPPRPASIRANWSRQSHPGTSTGRCSPPAQARASLARVERAGFLAGLNEILLIGGGLTLAGALFALWLVRKQDIDEHAAATFELVPEPSAAR